MDSVRMEIRILEPVTKVWEYFTDPYHIRKWNFAYDKWYCPSAEIDLREGGRFSYRMEAKDRTFGLDFAGVFTEIIPMELIRFILDDGRKVEIRFEKVDEDTTDIVEFFEPEKENSREMQRESWYAILNNFHKYVENH